MAMQRRAAGLHSRPGFIVYILLIMTSIIYTETAEGEEGYPIWDIARARPGRLSLTYIR
ncbi:hypothetical protein KNP414_04499 [Paenibacillus mucilaginosus KNP414]|uniref:Uncharacterized protein n=1 Tax=Paenibacillus mucilaginosus (strain KNP414) TaxID=1036673 RepID=F8F9A1_PAEMK|nr:hypothetical protein KNP414_04499 [Paenibacillus mucilaginosus KNP414]